MATIESLIKGSEKLTEIFGYWPTFHDAEIFELHFWRGRVDADKGIYDFPVLSLRIHVWALSEPPVSRATMFSSISRLRPYVARRRRFGTSCWVSSADALLELSVECLSGRSARRT